jgi:hypothetical protein
MVTTWRLITPVIAIRPTFWLNEVLGSAPKTPEIAVPKPSAKVAPWISLSVASRPGAALGDTADVAHRLDRRDEGHQAEADDRGYRELDPEMEGVRQGDGGGAPTCPKLTMPIKYATA